MYVRTSPRVSAKAALIAPTRGECGVRFTSHLRAWRHVFDNLYTTVRCYRSTNCGSGPYAHIPSLKKERVLKVLGTSFGVGCTGAVWTKADCHFAPSPGLTRVFLELSFHSRTDVPFFFGDVYFFQDCRDFRGGDLAGETRKPHLFWIASVTMCHWDR